MNKALNPYVNDIIAIAGENDVSWSIGVDMFLTNLRSKKNLYKGADHLDWEEIANDIGPLEPSIRADMVNTFNENYRKNMSKIIAFRKAGKYEKVIEIMMS